MRIEQNNHPLAAIICGYERGGTTLVSEFLRHHPKFHGGFEGGFLMAQEAYQFLEVEPYCSQVVRGWNVTAEEMRYICSPDNWPEVYRRLLEKSRLVNPCQDKNKDISLFDKTPKYMSVLRSVLMKVPDVPCIAIVRDPRAVLWSQGRRSFKPVSQWISEDLDPLIDRYILYSTGLRIAKSSSVGNRILVIKYEELCQNIESKVQEIFSFIKSDYDPACLNFKTPWPNVYGKGVSQEYMNEYRSHFTEDVCQKILDRTKDFQEFWHI